MQADGASSTLSFAGGTVNNTGGLIEATNSGVVNFGSVTIQSGALGTSGGGLVQTISGTVGTLNAPTLNSGTQVTVQNNSQLVLIGTIANNGAITVNAGANLTDIRLSSDNALFTGTGVITLSGVNLRPICTMRWCSDRVCYLELTYKSKCGRSYLPLAA